MPSSLAIARPVSPHARNLATSSQVLALWKGKGKGYPHQTEPLFAPHLPHLVLEFVPPDQLNGYAYTSGFFFSPNCSALNPQPVPEWA